MGVETGVVLPFSMLEFGVEARGGPNKVACTSCCGVGAGVEVTLIAEPGIGGFLGVGKDVRDFLGPTVLIGPDVIEGREARFGVEREEMFCV